MGGFYSSIQNLVVKQTLNRCTFTLVNLLLFIAYLKSMRCIIKEDSMRLSLFGLLHHQHPLLHVSIHRNLYFPLPLPPLLPSPLPHSRLGVDTELRSSDWLRVTQEKTWRTNGSSPWLMHHSEVMWSGGGLKQVLISVHTVTLQRHDRLHVTRAAPLQPASKTLFKINLQVLLGPNLHFLLSRYTDAIF